jgi:hypothetical protein
MSHYMSSLEGETRPTPEQPQPLLIDVETQRAMLDMLLEDLPHHILAMMNHRYTTEATENVAKVRKMATTIAKNLGQEVPPGNALGAGLIYLVPDDMLRGAANEGDPTAIFLLSEKIQSEQQIPTEPTF